MTKSKAQAAVGEPAADEPRQKQGGKTMKNSIFTPEKRRAWDDVLFWARRLSYKSAEKHPEWRQRYEEAKQRLNAIEAREDAERSAKHDLLQAR